MEAIQIFYCIIFAGLITACIFMQKKIKSLSRDYKNHLHSDMQDNIKRLSARIFQQDEDIMKLKYLQDNKPEYEIGQTVGNIKIINVYLDKTTGAWKSWCWHYECFNEDTKGKYTQTSFELKEDIQAFYDKQNDPKDKKSFCVCWDTPDGSIKTIDGNGICSDCKERK